MKEKNSTVCNNAGAGHLQVRPARSVRRVGLNALSGILVAFLFCGLVEPIQAAPPTFGVRATLVPLPANVRLPQRLRGFRVDSVRRGSHGAQMGLKRGDIIVSVDGLFFQNRKAFDWIMKGVGKVADVGVIDIRTGRLVQVKHRFNHVREKRGRAPGGVMAKAGAPAGPRR